MKWHSQVVLYKVYLPFMLVNVIRWTDWLDDWCYFLRGPSYRVHCQSTESEGGVILTGQVEVTFPETSTTNSITMEQAHSSKSYCSLYVCEKQKGFKSLTPFSMSLHIWPVTTKPIFSWKQFNSFNATRFIKSYYTGNWTIKSL